MSNTNKDISKEVVTTKPPKAAATPTRLALLGPPPLLEGEERAAYEQHLARVTEAGKPADILEEIWVRDFVDHDWVICRLRRFQTSLLTANAHGIAPGLVGGRSGYMIGNTIIPWVAVLILGLVLFGAVPITTVRL